MGARLTFHGAARTVTGSKHLLEIGNKTVLIDCGMFQGPRELREQNWKPFPFDVRGLDAVILTHAHTDHVGMIPKLVKEGFQGPIFSTPATLGISRISLPDSARLAEEEARRHNRHRTSRHDPALPLYTEEDAYKALRQFKTVKFHEFFDIPGGAKVRFLPAGHILGSAFAEIYFQNGERLLMGGDLGRYDVPVMVDPEAVDFAEYLVIESTYGDRLHGDENPVVVLEALLNEAYREGRAILVPSFSIGRTQELLYYVSLLQHQGRIPRVPVFLDSPMAVKATELYRHDNVDKDEDMKIALHNGYDPLEPDHLTLIRDRNQSKALNSQRGPMMVIAGSGMASGGRILHHLRHRLDDPNTVVLFTGFQAEGTLGRDLLEGAPEVHIFGDPIPVRAQIERMTSLSAHADQGEMMRWLGNFVQAPKKTFLVHGEPDAMETLKEKIESEMGWNVVIPGQGMTFNLD